jgi:flagellar hook-length control protein FliK
MFSMPAWVNPAPPPQRPSAPGSNRPDTGFDDVLSRTFSSRDASSSPGSARPASSSGGESSPGDADEQVDDADLTPSGEASSADDGDDVQATVGQQQSIDAIASNPVIEPLAQAQKPDFGPPMRPNAPADTAAGTESGNADASEAAGGKSSSRASNQQLAAAVASSGGRGQEGASPAGSSAAAGDATPDSATRPDASAAKGFDVMLGQAARRTDGSPATPAPQGTPATPEQAAADRVATAITTKLLPKGGKMEIRLDPPHLGRIHIDVRVISGRLTATFTATNEEASRMLGHKLDHLRQSLETSGLTVDRLQVKTSSESSMRDAGADQQQQSTGQDQRQGQSQEQRDLARRLWKRAVFGTDGLDVVG